VNQDVGKTTVGRTFLGLYEATAGEVIYEGIDIAKKMTRNYFL